MSKHGSARVVLAGVAIAATAALAGCGGVPKGTKPDVPGENAGGTAAAAATSRLSSPAPLTARPNSFAERGGGEVVREGQLDPVPCRPREHVGVPDADRRPDRPHHEQDRRGRSGLGRGTG